MDHLSVGDGNHPTLHQSMTGKENKDAKSYLGPCSELLTRVTLHTARMCLWPFPRRNLRAVGYLLETRTNDTPWRHRNPFQHGNSCFLLCWSLLHLCTAAPPTFNPVPTTEQEGVKPKLSFSRAGTEPRVHTTTAEPTWPYLHLIPLPCEARAHQPLSDSVPNSQEKNN